MIYKQFVNSLIENATKEYPKRSFHLTELLAFGSEGGAFLAIAKNWGKNPQNVVIKIQKNMKANEKDFLNKLIIYQDQYESGNNKQYLPSNLIRVFECFEWKENNCVLMEVGGQSLFDYITMKTDLQMEERVKICFEICYPLYFLHQQKLIHRDIKPENFIKVGEIFKLIDFGLIRSSFSDNKTQQVGNVIFQAPEILENSSSYTEKVDIWSLGCVFYEVLSGQALLDGQTYDEITTGIKNHKHQPQLLNNKINQLQTEKRVKDILIEMMTYQDKNRPSIETVYLQFKSYFEKTPNQSQLPQQILQINNNLEQQLSLPNVAESKLKEIQSQIESLNQNIICIIQQQQVEKDKQIQEQQKNQDESKKFNLNLNTFQQQITKNNSDQKNIFDEKLKNIDTRLSQYEKKVSDLEERIYKCLKQQNQKISKLEETNEVLKKEISVQNSLSVKTFQTQLGEVKQNLQDQINTLRQNQLQQNESYIKREQEYKNMSIDFTTIIDQWKEYKNKINTDQEKIQVQQQSQDQKLEKIAEMLNIQIIENKNQITELNKDNADLKSQIDILKQNYSLKTELEDLQKKSQDDKVKLLESQVQILLLQNQLAQAIMPVNQVKALIDYFRDKKNLNEFLRKIRKNLQD